MKLRTLQVKVKQAAKRLDKLKPDWAKHVDISIARMCSLDLCILGQIYKDEAAAATKKKAEEDPNGYNHRQDGYSVAPNELVREHEVCFFLSPLDLEDSNGKEADWDEKHKVVLRLWAAQIKPRKAKIAKEKVEAEAMEAAKLEKALATPPQLITMYDVLVSGMKYLLNGKLGAQSGINAKCKYDYQDENGSRCIVGTAFNDDTLLKVLNRTNAQGSKLNSCGTNTMFDIGVIICPEHEYQDMAKLQNAHDNWGMTQKDANCDDYKTKFLLLFGQFQTKYNVKVIA